MGRHFDETLIQAQEQGLLVTGDLPQEQVQTPPTIRVLIKELQDIRSDIAVATLGHGHSRGLRERVIEQITVAVAALMEMAICEHHS